MKLYPDSKVYVLCPRNYASGGPELCHQLCSQLIRLNINAFMFYIPNTSKNNPVPEVYIKYHLPYTFDLEDSEKNIFVIPEYFSEYLYTVKKIQRVFWWLSVDNYIKKISILLNSHLSKVMTEPTPKFFYFSKEDSNITHFFQSEYTRQFIIINGITNAKSVETCMNQNFLNYANNVDLNKKENIVAYNPSKGIEITQQLIKLAPDIDWRPIKGMTVEQVKEFLTKAKVYIDFGNFPGRERLPREASLMGCVVITGKRGAAANDIDINIPAEFKFDDSKLNPQQVIEKIRMIFENFVCEFNKQKAFRDKELAAKKNFTNEVAEAFEIKNLPLLGVAIAQGVGYESFLLAQELSQSTIFKPSFIIDDALATEEISDGFIFREQNRNYLRTENFSIEIISSNDAKFLYLEERIRKFALLAPTKEKLAELKNFYGAVDADVLIFNC
ncbi:MAG: hypothetical protein IJK81_01020 [Selenomonadaceae bacterium]|nr:hypothetical protein [Selenomonadaceae bacterium]